MVSSCDAPHCESVDWDAEHKSNHRRGVGEGKSRSCLEIMANSHANAPRPGPPVSPRPVHVDTRRLRCAARFSSSDTRQGGDHGLTIAIEDLKHGVHPRRWGLRRGNHLCRNRCGCGVQRPRPCVSSRKRRSCGLHVVAGRNLTGQPPPVEPLVGTVLEMV